MATAPGVTQWLPLPFVDSCHDREAEMAEHFRGRRLTVHTSNAGANEMLNAWLVLGRRLAATEERDAVLAFLQTRIERGDGWKAFSLNPPPNEISSPSRITVLAQILTTFAEELAKDQPDLSLTNICWSHDLRLGWLANPRPARNLG
jgi:hypothetical protein